MSLDPFHDLAGRTMARLLLEAGAIQISEAQPFFLAAGWASPVYVDCRVLIGDVQRRRKVTDLAVAAIRRSPSGEFNAVAGAETAGIPWASSIADRLTLPLRYVRKRPLGIGRNAQVEGGSVEGLRVLLVDDLTTDGSSKVPSRAAFARQEPSSWMPSPFSITAFSRVWPSGSRAWDCTCMRSRRGTTSCGLALMTGSRPLSAPGWNNSWPIPCPGRDGKAGERR